MTAANPYRQRSDSRRMAFQLLFSVEMNDYDAETLFDKRYYCAEIGIPCDFSRRLLVGTRQHLDEIDALISSAAIGWQISRMPLVDKSILRLAVYEMLYEDDVPLSVSIDEAVELAKEFGGEEKSPAFVNGVLGKIALKVLNAQGAAAGEGGEAAAADEGAVADGSEAAVAGEAAAGEGAADPQDNLTDNSKSI